MKFKTVEVKIRISSLENFEFSDLEEFRKWVKGCIEWWQVKVDDVKIISKEEE